MYAIRAFYHKYRPEEYEAHVKNRDWIKNCPLKRQKVQPWVNNFKNTGYHRLRGSQKINKLNAPIRPRTGPDSLHDIHVSDYHKSILVNAYHESKVEVEI